jgi:hypothetical protein
MIFDQFDFSILFKRETSKIEKILMKNANHIEQAFRFNTYFESSGLVLTLQLCSKMDTDEKIFFNSPVSLSGEFI